MNKLAQEFLKADDEKANDYATEAFEIADSMNFTKGKANGLLILGDIQKSKGNAGEAFKYYNEAAKTAAKNEHYNIRLTALKNLGILNTMTGNFDEAIESFEEIREINENLRDSSAVAQAIYNTGNVYRFQGNTDSALAYYEKALNFRREIGDASPLADSYYGLGYLYYAQNQYYKALDYCLNALAIYEEQQNKSRQALTLNVIGIIYDGLGDIEKAKQYGQRALNINQELNEQRATANSLNNLANLYSKEENYQQALQTYQEALDIYQELNSIAEMATITANLGIVNYELKNYQKAIELCNEAISLTEKVSIEVGKIGPYITMANIYLETGRIKNAEKHALLALQIAEQNNHLKHLSESHELLNRIYAQKQDYRSAYKHHQQFKKLQDSIFNTENIKKVTQLENQYQFEKEKQAIALEQEKKDILQAEEMRQQRLIRNAIIIGLILVLISAIIIYFYYLQKQKANRKLSEQNLIISKQKEEKELLLREIHHRVKNNLQIISGMLDLQTLSTDSPISEAALKDAQNRLQSIAMIHEILHQNEDNKEVVFKELVNKLAGHISASLKYDNEIDIRIDIPGEYKFNIETALPLGLIITELLTNSFKYAFEKQDAAKIDIRLEKENGHLLLVVSDNGKGIPSDIDFIKSKSLGLRLINALSKQLSGVMQLNPENGTKFTFAFEPKS
ncbi:MAG: tetratricopeptide repeat protein [Bacteroidales bacterium]|nr:tetratricopeptide repeat protein [Bacteroidales bacterium]MCF8343325.1 tetratricopeptide repeat protein [Bacteroidales bacterium]MCF8351856.1 tetratricopeptide repeat protein [Bacteroidales bacterium]MCF8376402.1 tetratricopeptide repeat protein [Bacteroidales bacterium]